MCVRDSQRERNRDGRVNIRLCKCKSRSRKISFDYKTLALNSRPFHGTAHRMMSLLLHVWFFPTLFVCRAYGVVKNACVYARIYVYIDV